MAAQKKPKNLTVLRYRKGTFYQTFTRNFFYYKQKEFKCPAQNLNQLYIKDHGRYFEQDALLLSATHLYEVMEVAVKKGGNHEKR